MAAEVEVVETIDGLTGRVVATVDLPGEPDETVESDALREVLGVVSNEGRKRWREPANEVTAEVVTDEDGHRVARATQVWRR